MKKMLNVGCGHRYHPDWVNIDVDADSPQVIKADIIKGIPFNDNSFSVVYHSNVLEHLPVKFGKSLIKECYRVLEPNGILRINVPDLEKMAKEYLKNLELARSGDKMAIHNYNWILIEMFDQISRNESGGEMAEYLSQPEIPNPGYLKYRLGQYAENWRKAMNQSRKKKTLSDKVKTVMQKPELLKRLWYGIVLSPKDREYLKIGRFRLSGEVHYHMYDEWSLKKLLQETGFRDISLKDPVTSRISNWTTYDLDSPDDGAALIVEAIK